MSCTCRQDLTARALTTRTKEFIRQPCCAQVQALCKDSTVADKSCYPEGCEQWLCSRDSLTGEAGYSAGPGLSM